MPLNLTESGNPIVDYLKISSKAAEQILKLLAQRSDPCEGIRVGVRTRGCSGLSYTIEYALKEKNITKFDDVVILKNDLSQHSSSSHQISQNKNSQEIKIFIDPKVSMFLIGAEMIFESNDLSSGFDFVNPNEKGRCGCKESFTV